jgi:hypothetical protein
VNPITCEQCGRAFKPAPPQGFAEALSSERKFFDVAPELRDAEAATCPHCHHVQRAASYKFFGLLKARDMRIILILLIAGMLAFAIWWRFRSN